LRYELRRKKRWLGLGSVATFSLEEARQRARRARQLLADKIDPLEARRAERAQIAARDARNKSFAQVTAEYFDAHESGWSRSHRDGFLSSLKNHAATLNTLPISCIDETLVLNTLRPLWNHKTVTARRIQQRLAAVLDFASATGYRSGANPARWKGHLEHLLAAPERLATVAHYPDLKYGEMPEFMRELRGVPGIAARALEFLILTAARTEEVRSATWEEFDLDGRVWTVPARRMKGRVEHRVALSQQAITLLLSLPREGSFLFLGERAGASIGKLAMYFVSKALRADVTVHGFRATFKTWCEERTAFPAVVAEQALAHTVGNAVERAYRRTTLFEQRTRLMQTWADFIDTPVVGVREVTPLRRGRS
jgi:integrase